MVVELVEVVVLDELLVVGRVAVVVVVDVWEVVVLMVVLVLVVVSSVVVLVPVVDGLGRGRFGYVGVVAARGLISVRSGLRRLVECDRDQAVVS